MPRRRSRDPSSRAMMAVPSTPRRLGQQQVVARSHRALVDQPPARDRAGHHPDDDRARHRVGDLGVPPAERDARTRGRMTRRSWTTLAMRDGVLPTGKSRVVSSQRGVAPEVAMSLRVDQDGVAADRVGGKGDGVGLQHQDLLRGDVHGGDVLAHGRVDQERRVLEAEAGRAAPAGDRWGVCRPAAGAPIRMIAPRPRRCSIAKSVSAGSAVGAPSSMTVAAPAFAPAGAAPPGRRIRPANRCGPERVARAAARNGLPRGSRPGRRDDERRPQAARADLRARRARAGSAPPGCRARGRARRPAPGGRPRPRRASAGAPCARRSAGGSSAVSRSKTIVVKW